MKNVTKNQAGHMMNDLKVISDWQLSQHITHARSLERQSSLLRGDRGMKRHNRGGTLLDRPSKKIKHRDKFHTTP